MDTTRQPIDEKASSNPQNGVAESATREDEAQSASKTQGGLSSFEEEDPLTTRKGASREHRERRLGVTTEESSDDQPPSLRGSHRRGGRHISPYQKDPTTNDAGDSQQTHSSRSADVQKPNNDKQIQQSNSNQEQAIENPEEQNDESAKIHPELDLEAEVDMKAKVQGDVTLGLTE